MTPTAQQDLQPLTDELRRNKQRLKLALAAAQMGVWEWNALNNEVLLSPECYVILGRESSTLTPEFINGLFHPHDAERVSETTLQALKDGQLLEMEFRIVRPDGSVRWVNLFGRAEFDRDERPLRLVGAVQDITDRKLTAEKLQASEQQLREMADAMPQIVWTAAPDGGVTYINRRGAEYFGETIDGLLGRQWQRWIHPEDLSHTLRLWNSALQTECNHEAEHRILRKDGEYRWHVSRATPTHNGQSEIVRWIGTSTDIHDQKMAQAALRDSEERLHLAAEVAQIGMWDRDLKSNRLYWSATEERLMGYEPGTFPGTYEAFLELIHPADRPVQVEARQQAIATDGQYQSELRFRLRDGRERWGLVRGKVICDAQGVPQRILGIELDITERKRAEEALRANEARFRGLVEHGYDGITIVDAEQAVIYSSPANEQILGYAAVEILGRPALGLAHPDDQRDAQALFAAVVSSPNQVFHHTLRFRHRRGEWRWLECRLCNLINNPAIRGIVVNWRDISDRVKMEQNLLQKKHILEKIAAGENLRTVLEDIVRLVESQIPGSLCSILLLDDKSRRLRLGAGNNLPADYNAAIDGVKIGPAVGSCGTAAYSNKTVVVADIANDPLWANCRDLALTHGLKSCWSVPIQAASSGDTKNDAPRVLGTFALYRHEPAVPSPGNLETVAGAAHLAGIAIERELSERTVRESEERYRRIAEVLQAEHARFTQLVTAAPGVICSFQQRPDGSVSMPYASPGLLDLYGLRSDEVALDATPILSRIHPEDIKGVQQDVAESARTMSTWHSEYRFQHPLKGEIWIEGRSTPSRQPDGSLLWYGILTDVSQRRKDEAEFRRTAELLKAVADGTTDAVFVKDREGKYLFFNEAAARFVGRPVAEVLGNDDTKLFDAQSASEIMARDRAVLASGSVKTVEEKVTAGGITRTFMAIKAPYRDERGKTIGTIGVSRDITERKESERQLIESEERYRRLVEVLPDAVFITSQDEIVFCNPAFVRLMGASDARQLHGRSPMEFLEPQHHADIRQRIETMFTGGKPAPPREIDLLRVDGSAVPVFVAATPITYHSQPSILVVLHDLSELRRSAELLQSVMQSVIDAIVTIDAQGTIRSVNPAVEKLFGYDAAELVGHNVKILMPDPYRQMHDEYLGNYLRTGMAKVIGIGREVEGRRKDGSTFPAELEITEFSLDHVRHFTGVIRDITERKSLEAQFHQVQKMEAIGLLAGGVAHDFNNLLCVINGFADLLLQQKSPTATEYGPLQQIRGAGKRAADLTNQLLMFGRKAMIELKVLNLNEIVSRTEKLLIRLIGEDIRLSTEFDPDLCLVKVDSSQMEQVVLNLVVNARDALPPGGKITVTTRNVEIKSDTAHHPHAPQAGRYAELCVSDNGLGMTEEVKSKIFDPFFTTKGQSKGTGLGLAVVHGIVKQSEGHIEVRTKPGAGTTFRILLPAALVPAGVKSDAVSALPPPHGNETILLVEDEPAVLGIARRSLQTYGYNVLTATCGREALLLLDREQQPFHLLVTDVVMPEMNGRQLADVVLSRFPSIPVLFLSGYTADEVIRRGIMEADVEFLQKPFTPRSLARKVREILDRQAGVAGN